MTGVGENVAKLEHSYTASGNAKWYNHFGSSFIVTENLNVNFIICSRYSIPSYVTKEI